MFPNWCKENERPETAPSRCGWSARTLPTPSCLREAVSHIWGDLPNIAQHHPEDQQQSRGVSPGTCVTWHGGVGEPLSVCQETAQGPNVHIHAAIGVDAECQVGTRDCPRA